MGLFSRVFNRGSKESVGTGEKNVPMEEAPAVETGAGENPLASPEAMAELAAKREREAAELKKATEEKIVELRQKINEEDGEYGIDPEDRKAA